MSRMNVICALLMISSGCEKDPVEESSGTGAVADAGSETVEEPSGKWSMGYYASWKPDQYPIAEIEWSGLTHIAMAFYLPDGSGGLNLLGGNPDLATDLVAAAHANGVDAVASIGGADSETGFQQATAPGTMDTFVANLLDLVDTYGYDGIDMDWEPMATADQVVAADIAVRIREARPDVLLTIPIGIINVNLGTDLAHFETIAAAYDQLNLMSYGVSGAWEGWQSWHSSPLYHRQSSTPMSVDATVALYVAAGVPMEKLGVGIGFYGLCYGPPVTGPEQALDGSTILASDSLMSYANIMESYYSANAYFFDDFAKVPYLSFTETTGPEGCMYISYDDERSVEEKGIYVKENGLGGVIIWELNEGFLSDAPQGEKNPMLEAIHDHVLN